MVLIIPASLLLAASCETASVDRGAAQAQTGVPAAAQVEIVSIPYDPQVPTFVVAVEPLVYGASGEISGTGAASAPAPRGGVGGILDSGTQGGGLEGNPVQQHGPGAQVGAGMAEQLRTALTRSGNIQLIEADAITKNADGSYTCALEEGELGPYIIRGTVTEFNETADLSEEKKGGSLGGIGAIVGLAGLATGSKALGYTGAGVAIANPTYEKGDVKRSGMVGLDLRVVNGKNSRILGAFMSSGTFTTVSSTSGVSVFGIGKGNAEFAASALGQATRAAMNDAVQQTTDLLKIKAR